MANRGRKKISSLPPSLTPSQKESADNNLPLFVPSSCSNHPLNALCRCRFRSGAVLECLLHLVATQHVVDCCICCSPDTVQQASACKVLAGTPPRTTDVTYMKCLNCISKVCHFCVSGLTSSLVGSSYVYCLLDW